MWAGALGTLATTVGTAPLIAMGIAIGVVLAVALVIALQRLAKPCARFLYSAYASWQRRRETDQSQRQRQHDRAGFSHFLAKHIGRDCSRPSGSWWPCLWSKKPKPYEPDVAPSAAAHKIDRLYGRTR